MEFLMKYLIIALIIIFSPSLAFSQDTSERFVIYSTSTPFYGKEMVVEIAHDEILDTPIFETLNKEFPIKQSDAISTALD
jgi:hypothetical protein